MFEGDMVLSEEQHQEIKSSKSERNSFAASKRRQWPLPVVYDFDPSIGELFSKIKALLSTKLGPFTIANMHKNVNGITG